MAPAAGPAVGATPVGAVPDALTESARESAFAQVSHDSDATGGEDAELKASAPRPSSPKDGVEVLEARPFLTVTNAEPDEAFLSAFAEENFQYQFEIYRIDGGSRTEVEPATIVAGGSGTTSRQVTSDLDWGGSYEWRGSCLLRRCVRSLVGIRPVSDPDSQDRHPAIA